MTLRAGVQAATINSSNREDWQAIRERLRSDHIDLLLVSPERLDNGEFRDKVLRPSPNAQAWSLSTRRTASATGGTTSGRTTAASGGSLTSLRRTCPSSARRPRPTTG